MSLAPARRSCALALAALALLADRPARAAFDEFADGYSPTHFELRARYITLTLKGELEVELHDLEGEGGPGYDSPTDTRTIGTRSPTVNLDTFWLAPRVLLGELVGVNTILEFTTSTARIRAASAEVRATAPAFWRHHASLGYDTPIVTIDRRSERYPLIATIAWREPELHAAYEATFTLAERVELTVGLSLAMMRPLAPAPVREDTSEAGTINVLAYGPARSFSGNGPVGGGRLRLDAYGAFVEGFGFVGRLAAERGTDVLRSSFPNYRELPGYRAESNGYGEFFWVGARAGYEDHGVHALVEALLTHEDLLWRYGLYAQASYEIRLFREPVWFHTLEPLVRYEFLRLHDGARVNAGGQALRSPAPINAVSWDHDGLTLGLIARVWRDLVALRLEYAFSWEKNGVPGLGVADVPFRDNEFLLQAELRF